MVQQHGSYAFGIKFLAVVIWHCFIKATKYCTIVDEELKNLAGEVLELFKSTVGLEVFSREYATIQKQLGEKRSDRRQQKAMEVGNRSW